MARRKKNYKKQFSYNEQKNLSNVNDEALNVKILVSYHKKDALLKDSIITPINAGRALAEKNGNKDLEWLLKNCIGDNSGENISEKNSFYNEMTSIYWAWKNYDKIGNPDYIGHFHYRRHLCFDKTDKSVYEFGDIDDKYLTDKLGYSPRVVKALCRNNDLIIPKQQWRASAYEHFRRNFDISELDKAIEILNEKYPQYAESAEKYLASSELYFCNIFIMSKSLFFEYCDYMFTIMSEFEKAVDMTNKRMYISEWLTGIFIYDKTQKGIRYTSLPTAVAQSKITIPVLLVADKNYAMQMGVTATSLLSNAKEYTFYDLRCIVSKDFSEKDKTKILSLKNTYPNCNIRFYNIDESNFSNIKIITSHISAAAFYRLMAAEIFTDIDKLVYIDVDAIICEDLTVFYRYALDNKYIGGVRAPGYYLPEKWKYEKLLELQIPSMDQYINSGILLMNLKLIRNDGLVNRFIELAKKNFRSEDQDVLNVACYDKIRHLPFRFNAQTKYTNPKSNERYKMELVIPKDEIEDACKHPVIIHYANKVKPWHSNEVWLSDIWLEYARKSPYSNQVFALRAEKERLAKVKKEKIKAVRQKIVKDTNKIKSIPDNYTKCKEKKYKISVIIPCYNVADNINDCIESVILQTSTLPEIEIICVNDGSSDDTLNILIDWAEEFENIKIFVQNNKGSGPARNLGLSVASGEFVAFMDGDDLYPSTTTLENLYFSAKKNNVEICGGCFSTLNNEKISSNYKFPLDGYIFKERKIVEYKDYQYDFGYQRFIYSKKLLKENHLRFPDYRRYQDPPFFANAMISAKRFMAVPELSYRYRIQHKEIGWNEEKVCDMLLAITDMFEIAKKHNLHNLYFYTYLRLKNNLPIIRQQIIMLNQRVFLVYSDLLKIIDFDFIRHANKYSCSKMQDADLKELIDVCSSKENYYEEKISQFQNRLYILEKAQEINERVHELSKLEKERNEAVDRLNKYEYEAQNSKWAFEEIDRIRNSLSFKVGRLITWLPRKVREVLKKRTKQ